jgi:hypothetical protein
MAILESIRRFVADRLAGDQTGPTAVPGGPTRMQRAEARRRDDMMGIHQAGPIVPLVRVRAR